MRAVVLARWLASAASSIIDSAVPLTHSGPGDFFTVRARFHGGIEGRAVRRTLSAAAPRRASTFVHATMSKMGLMYFARDGAQRTRSSRRATAKVFTEPAAASRGERCYPDAMEYGQRVVSPYLKEWVGAHSGALNCAANPAR